MITVEVEAVARRMAERQIRKARRHDTASSGLEAMQPAAIDYVWPEFVDDARAAIAALDQVRGK